MTERTAESISPDSVRVAARSLIVAAPVPVAPSIAEALETYAVALAKFGAHTDLVGARSAAALCEIALLDALVLARHVDWLDAPCWEIGAGGASLLVPLVVLDTALTGVVVEPRQKRATFLRMAIGVLGLGTRLRVAQERIETDHAARAFAGSALSRAVLAPAPWMALATRVVRPGGTFVVLDTEPPVAPLGLTQRAIERYEVPSTHAPRVACWMTTDTHAV